MPCPELLPNDHSPAHAIGGVNNMPIPKLGRRLCCRLQLSWLPVNRSSEGDTQSCCIVIGIVVEHIYKPAVLVMYYIEGTAPTSWSVVDSHTQPLGPNDGLCCQCRNWRRFSVAMLTSARQTKWKIVISFLNTSAHNLLYGGRYVRTYAKVCLCRYHVEIGITCCTVAHRNWRRFSVAMLTSARQTKWKC